MRACGVFLHRYAGYTWESMMLLPCGVWDVLVREASRQMADEDHRRLVVTHSSDVKDLEERLRYAACPEQAWWAQPADSDAAAEALMAKLAGRH